MYSLRVEVPPPTSLPPSISFTPLRISSSSSSNTSHPSMEQPPIRKSSKPESQSQTVSHIPNSTSPTPVTATSTNTATTSDTATTTAAPTPISYSDALQGRAQAHHSTQQPHSQPSVPAPSTTPTSTPAPSGGSTNSMERSVTATKRQQQQQQTAHYGESTDSVTTVEITTGNPMVEITKGFVHLYKDNAVKEIARPHELPTKRTPILVVMAVPSSLTSSDFCQLVAPFLKLIKHMRVVSNSTPGRYMVVIQFREQGMADEFYLQFNGKPFSSLEPEICQLGFAKKVEYIRPRDESMPPYEGQTELPTCPVCLERMDASVTGILTIMCNHSFHCLCLSKWRRDSSCPVCRYCQETNDQRSVCTVCEANESLWICLICGHIGCGRYKSGHANDHYVQTHHNYSLELETQRVWDYAGDNYVHRLIQNRTDGKLVELSGPDMSLEGFKDEVIESKRTAVALEYTYLLTSQLETQRTYFEKEMEKVTADKEARIEHLLVELAQERERNMRMEASLQDAEKYKKSSRKRIAKLEQKMAQQAKETEFLKQCNDLMRQNQDELKQLTAQAKVKIRESEESTLQRVHELEEQVRDLMFYIDASKKIENSTDKADIADGHILITEAPEKPKGGRRSRGKRSPARGGRG